MTGVLVTGSGRCGTTWAWQVLRDAGYPAEHQQIRHEHSRLDGPPIPAGGIHVSYEAAPLAGELRAAGWRIVVLLRDPYRVALSWDRLGAFEPDTGYDELHGAVGRWAPEVMFQPDSFNRALAFAYAWPALALPYADAHCLMPETSSPSLLAACGLDPDRARLAPPRDLNHDPLDERADPH